MSMSGYIFDVISAKDESFSEAICAICDNGGELICCEGKCLRAFHASVDAGIDSACDSLHLSDKQIKEGTFKCDNCRYNQHQCYVCGKLGSSDKSSGAEVFQCGACTCGYFYHPSCVANALRFMCEDKPREIEAEISSGKPFICPLHFCYACKQKEKDNETSVLMQFAVCRRCPMAYHRQCLPGSITFEDDDDEGILTRAWDDLIPNKILIYCMEHAMDEELETPLRDHLKFPNTKPKKGKQVKESVAEREPKSRHASKTTLQKSSSSTSHRNSSGVYSFRDRKLVTKYKMVSLLAALENNASSKKNMDVVMLSNNNMDNVGSENRRKSSKDVEASGISDSEKKVESFKDDSVVSINPENQESSCSEKKKRKSCENDSLGTKSENRRSFGSSKIQRKIIKEGPKENHVEKVADIKDSKAGKFKNHVKICSDKKSKSSNKEEEEEEDENHSDNRNSMNSSSSGMDEAKSFSKTTFKSLDFFSGPYCPPAEYSSIGWLTE